MTQPTRTAPRYLLPALLFFAIAVGLVSLRYFTFDKQDLMHSKPAALLADEVWRLGFYVHIGASVVALIVGGLNFISSWRTQHIQRHRLLGRIYIWSVALGGISALAIAPNATAGLVAQLGFAGLGLAWLFATYRAYGYIHQKNIAQHRRWMHRSYALTFAAVTLRIILPTELALLHMDFNSAYRIVAWACWVPNLVVMEWWLWREQRLALAGPPQ